MSNRPARKERMLLALVAALVLVSCVSAPALAQVPEQMVHLLYPSDAAGEAMVVPTASPVRMASFSRDLNSRAVFRGRFTVSGTYEVEPFDDGFFVSFWPDKKSRSVLPFWRQRGGPIVIGLSGSSEFAEAVVSRAKLQKLRAGKLSSVRGHVTIVAEDYESFIECDAAYFNARFVSVVTPALAVAAAPKTVEGC